MDSLPDTMRFVLTTSDNVDMEINVMYLRGIPYLRAHFERDLANHRATGMRVKLDFVDHAQMMRVMDYAMKAIDRGKPAHFICSTSTATNAADEDTAVLSNIEEWEYDWCRRVRLDRQFATLVIAKALQVHRLANVVATAIACQLQGMGSAQMRDALGVKCDIQSGVLEQMKCVDYWIPVRPEPPT